MDAPEAGGDLGELEPAFQRVEEALRQPARLRPKTRVLVISLAAFVAFFAVQHQGSVADLAMLVGVLFVHELGHAAAMRAFGYRDVTIFFIPLFGAAASGRRGDVASWKHALVLLAGPLPGIAAGGVLVACHVPGTRVLALELLILNGINLLPVVPLDGGQLLRVVLFSRHRLLEIGFVGLTAAALLAVAAYTHQWAIAAVAYVVLVTLGHRARVLGVAERWRDRNPPDDPRALPEPERRALFRDVWRMLPAKWQQRWRDKPAATAGAMTQVLEAAHHDAPSAAATVLALALWLAGLAGAGAATYVVILPPAHWHVVAHEAPRFTIDAPAELRAKPAGGHVLLATRGRKRAYVVAWQPWSEPDATRWLDAKESSLVAKGTDEHDLPAPPGERRFELHMQGLVTLFRLVPGDGYVFTVAATAPDDEPDSRRFIASFTGR